MKKEGNPPFTFIARDDEIRHFGEFLSFDKNSPNVKYLVIRGESGVGKSFFLKKCLRDSINKNESNLISVYIDLTNDEFQSSRVLFSLLNLLLVSVKPSDKYPICIPNKLSLNQFHKKVINKKKSGWTIFKMLSKAIASIGGVGKAVEALLDGTDTLLKSKNSAAEEILLKYIDWAGKQTLVILAIDNYQFMNQEVKNSLETVINRATGNIRFIVVDRTEDGVSQVRQSPFFLSENCSLIELKPFTVNETKKMVEGVVSVDTRELNKIAEDVYMKTTGVAKDIEFCLNEYSRTISQGAKKTEFLGLLATLDKLPLMHQQLLMIASLLDGGVNRKLAINAILNADNINSPVEVGKILDELIKLEYLKINSSSGNRIRPGHERIIQATKTVGNQEVFEIVRSSLITEIKNILKNNNIDEGDDYLLHCLVGLQTVNELRNNLYYISRLVRIQYRQEQFAYLVTISNELNEILSLLPDSIIFKVLDSYQKSSSFEKGLHLIRTLEEGPITATEDLLIFKFKFLIQLYEYSKARALIKKLPDTPWVDVYKLNLLMALEHNELALEVVRASSNKNANNNEAQAVIFRNSITLLGPKEALLNLDKAYQIFETQGSDYRLATVETNRSVVYLSQGALGDSLRVLNSAIEKLESVGSDEIYQAYLNLGITHLFNQKYSLSQDFIQKSLSLVPIPLLLDQIKIKANHVLVMFLCKQITENEAIEKLKNLLTKIKGTEMPYLRRVLKHNIAVINNSFEFYEEILQYIASEKRVSLYLPILSPTNSGRYLIIISSVHWRY